MKRILFGILILITLLGLAGCGNKDTANTGPQTGMNGPVGQEYLDADPSSIPLQKKLGIGTLKLEGTDLAVTSEQAKTLLPLWKALKSLSSDTNTTAEEINALNRQIEESMTADQIKAIKNMTWTADEIGQLVQKFGGMQANAQPASTETASNAFPGGGGGPGGGPGGGMGGPPMGGGGGMMPMGGANMENPASARTAVPGQLERREAGGMNLMFVEPVIQLLESKISG
jgi:HAMP domain-containing protein